MVLVYEKCGFILIYFASISIPVKELLYKVKRERDSYKHSNMTLQKSLSEAIASRSSLETQHQEALDVMLATAEHEKKRIQVELKQATESKRKLKKLVSEMIEEKALMEEELKKNADAFKAAETKVNTENGFKAKLEEERTRHFSALSSAITDLEAKFEADLQEVIKEKDEQLEREKNAYNHLRTRFEATVKAKDEELEREKRTHSTVLKAMEEENKLIREELDLANDGLTKLRDEHAKCCDLKEKLASKNAEITALELKLSDRNNTYTQEYDRMKAHLTEMCNLVESSSADRDRAREETKKLKAEVERRDTEHKAEISRLKHKLENGTKEMMQHCASILLTDGNMTESANSTQNKSSQSEVLAEKVSEESSDEECTHLGDIEKLPTDEDDCEVIKEERDGLASKVMLLELELAGLKAQLDLSNEDRDVNDKSSAVNASAIEEERDELASKVHMLETTLAAKRKDLATLEVKLDIANQEQEIVGTEEQDLCEYTMAKINKINMDCGVQAIKVERDQLQTEVRRLEALLKKAKLHSVDPNATPLRCPTKSTDDTCTASYKKEIELLQASLNGKKEELVQLEEKLEKLEEELSDCKIKACMYESMERERDNLSTELAMLKATAEAPDDASAAARLGEDLSNLRLEHRVEVKLLKKDHAATKTKVKLLKKELQKIGNEQEEMIKAYDIERQSNAELSSSLEEMVTLLEKERVVHSDQIESVRNKLDSLKFKLSKMRKKRVPIDAAYRATRLMLDRYEAAEKTQQELINDTTSELARKSSADDELELERIQSTLLGKEVEINLLKEELDKAKSRAAELELQLREAFDGSADDSINAALSEKQVQIEALRNDLAVAKSLYEELNQTYFDDMNATRAELKAEMSRLQQAHSDSIQAYTDAGNKYEDEITKAKAAVAEKNAELESISHHLDDAKAELEKAKSHLQMHVLQDEETIGNLNKQVKDERELQETLRARVDILEEELANTTAELEEKEAEIELLTQQLNDTKDGLDELEAQLEIHVQEDGETIERLEQQISNERQLREVSVQKLGTLTAVIEELNAKLASSEVNYEAKNLEHSDELMHATEAREQAEAELKASQEEVKELQAKLADFENIIASLNLARDELLNDATERQEELKSSRDVIDELKSTLVELKENLASLQCECSQLKQANEVANCAQKGYEQDAKNSSEEIELLKKQMRSSEIEFKQRLKAEVDRLKSGEYIENYSCDC